MINKVYFFVLASLCLSISVAQDKDVQTSDNSALQVVSEKSDTGAVVKEGQKKKEAKKRDKVHSKKLNPARYSIAPIRASFYSALIPGLGQIYNKKYWKVPIIYALMTTAFLVFQHNNNEYNRARNAYKRRAAGFKDDEFYNIDNISPLPDTPSINNQTLLSAQRSVAEDRDLAMLIFVGIYALNIIDANVDAHLKYFTVSDKLTFKLRPYIYKNSIVSTSAATNAGFSLTLNL